MRGSRVAIQWYLPFPPPGHSTISSHSVFSCLELTQKRFSGHTSSVTFPTHHLLPLYVIHTASSLVSPLHLSPISPSLATSPSTTPYLLPPHLLQITPSPRITSSPPAASHPVPQHLIFYPHHLQTTLDPHTILSPLHSCFSLTAARGVGFVSFSFLSFSSFWRRGGTHLNEAGRKGKEGREARAAGRHIMDQVMS